MRRAELTRALKSIKDKVSDLSLLQRLTSFMDTRRAPPSDRAPSKQAESLMESIREFSFWVRNSSAAVQQVVTVLEMDRLDNIEHWSKLMSGDRAAYSDTYRPLLFITRYLPNFITLLEREIDRMTDHPEGYPNQAILRVIALEAEGGFSSPGRIVSIIQSIEDLYGVCALLEKEPGSSLSIVGCDSGSDKSFDFLGVAKVIECVKAVILSLWDRVVYYRERKLSARLQLVAESLPVLERIKELEVHDAISPEQAEILRRKVTTSVGALLSAGITIPEISDNTVYNPRQLMAPEPKMLSAGVDAEPRIREHSTGEPLKKAVKRKKHEK